MGPPSYMRSVVDGNVVIRRIPVLNSISVLHSVGNVTGERDGIWQCKASCTVRTVARACSSPLTST